MNETTHIKIINHPSTRGWFTLIHKLSGYNLITLKGKDTCLALAQELESNCNLSFNAEDVEQGNYPYDAMSKLINQANDKCLNEVLAKRSKRKISR